MFLFFSFLIISQIIISFEICEAGKNFCSKCNPISKLCEKCEKNIYIPDSKGGCENSKKCILGYNHCVDCFEDEKLCKECDIGYFPDENGGCSLTDNCQVSYKGECLECKNNYILIGRKNYYATLNDYIRLCMPLNSDNFQNCKSINYQRGVCDDCESGYYLDGYDKKCTKVQNCAISSYGICKKCNYQYYLNVKEQKCILESNNFLNCKISNDGKKCDECNNDYYFDEEGKCVYSNFCSQGTSDKCNKCKDGYYLTSYGNICTTEENCFSGRKDIGICTQCNENYCIDFKDGKCKSNQEDNDLKDCRIADGKCTECTYGSYLGNDKKCSNTPKCEKAENGICIQCINQYHLGLDKKCTNVEHCIYSDDYYNCVECEMKYYYNIKDRACKNAEGKFENCMHSSYDGKYCDKCKKGFYINRNDDSCYSNKEPGDFYNCEISNGEICTKCIDGFYLGYSDHKCTKAQNCDIVENENRCLICDETYCVDGKTGLCEDNDIINDIEKIFYFRCNRTDSESTKCETCIEGYELKNGLCFDDKHCIERNENGSCKRCKKFEDEYYEQCLNDIFGCIEAYYDENCLECNDLSEVGDCTGCMEGFELDGYNNCVEID